MIGTPFYELRIKVNQEFRIILFTIDHDNFAESNNAILLNGHINKSTKDYLNAIEIAKALLLKYKKKIMNNLTDAANYLDIKIGKEGSVERAAFKDDAYA